MSSIYRAALGADFERLHPLIQRRFGFGAENRVAAIGRGTMYELWHGPLYTLPFLWVGSWRHIMFPERGHNVPFTIENYAYHDALGRETMTWLRTFETRRRRRFDAYMVFDARRGLIVDYLGSHQHLAVDLHASVDDRGGMHFVSGEQRFYEGPIAFRWPLTLSGIADVHEWYDDAAQRFRVDVRVSNRVLGRLFGYSGAFQVEWKPLERDQIPAYAFPRRVEPRF